MFKFITDLFLKVCRTIKAVLKAVFTASFQLLLEKLKDVAAESIKKLATTDLTNSQKREEVFREIKQYALSRALTFNDRDINLVIEIMYSSLKNSGVIK